ncbi:MAG: bifunctional riboflavin kinase/FAD synthetase [Acidobacteriota bacterium]
MIVARRRGPLPGADGRPVIATCGNFDGVHLGHQAIMRRIRERADASGGLATVITFHPHPMRVLAPDRAPRLMLTEEQKLAELERLGVDAVVILPFDREIAAMPAEEFARRVLAEELGVREIHVGPDFRFGRGRVGDVGLLTRLGTELGFEAHAVPPVIDGGERVSASRIRRELAAGRVEEAARLLGRPFTLVGTIVHGEGRGHKQLLPTANLAPENEFVPERGVYVTRTRWNGQQWHGLTNVGIRPTFGGRRVTIETFLSGFAGDLYGRRVELAFLARLRPEHRFDTPQQLMEQIWRDIDAFEAWCREHGVAVEAPSRGDNPAGS